MNEVSEVGAARGSKVRNVLPALHCRPKIGKIVHNQRYSLTLVVRLKMREVEGRAIQRGHGLQSVVRSGWDDSAKALRS